jgi:hypothetical protein
MNRIGYLSAKAIDVPIPDAAPSPKTIRKLTMAFQTALECLTDERRAEFEQRWEATCRQQGFTYLPLP